jgi:predicted acyltransferase
MKIHWWGILGLIGWAYLINSIIYIYFGKSIFILILAFLIFQVLNVLEFKPIANMPSIKVVVSASMHSSVCAGMLIGSLIQHFRSLKKENLFPLVLFLFGTACIIYGFALRPYWGGFSKIRATPSWASVCIGISALTFFAMYILIDKLKFTTWIKPIKIAGTNTLTCYLVPYIIYPVLAITSLSLPKYYTDGSIGLFKSFLFALLVIGVTGLLDKVNIKLKV